MIINILQNILQQGLCYALVAMGVYISYKILDFPDLTVDGSFPLGGVIGFILITSGVHYSIAIIAAFLCGCLAGLVTGILHVKFKISNLLSGILTMTALISVTLKLAKLRTTIPYLNHTTLFNDKLISIFGAGNEDWAKILILVVLVIIFKIILDLFLKTKTGFMLRAVGNNEQMCTSMGSDNGNFKILGLMIANGMVALAGTVYSQMYDYYDNSSGTGMVVLALASVIIGYSIFKNIKFIKGTTSAIVGALIYTACLVVIVACGVPSVYLKLIMATLFALILIINKLSGNNKFKLKNFER